MNTRLRNAGLAALGTAIFIEAWFTLCFVGVIAQSPLQTEMQASGLSKVLVAFVLAPAFTLTLHGKIFLALCRDRVPGYTAVTACLVALIMLFYTWGFHSQPSQSMTCAAITCFAALIGINAIRKNKLLRVTEALQITHQQRQQP